MAHKDRLDAIRNDLSKAMVSRDSFARQETHSSRVKDPTGKGCDWCGQKAGEMLKKYHIETDGGSKHPIKGHFCSKDCMETYHG